MLHISSFTHVYHSHSVGKSSEECYQVSDFQAL